MHKHGAMTKNTSSSALGQPNAEMIWGLMPALFKLNPANGSDQGTEVGRGELPPWPLHCKPKHFPAVDCDVKKKELCWLLAGMTQHVHVQPQGTICYNGVQSGQALWEGAAFKPIHCSTLIKA